MVVMKSDVEGGVSEWGGCGELSTGSQERETRVNWIHLWGWFKLIEVAFLIPHLRPSSLP